MGQSSVLCAPGKGAAFSCCRPWAAPTPTPRPPPSHLPLTPFPCPGCPWHQGILPPNSGHRTNVRATVRLTQCPWEIIKRLLDLTVRVHPLPFKGSPGSSTLRSKIKSSSHPTPKLSPTTHSSKASNELTLRLGSEGKLPRLSTRWHQACLDMESTK